MEKVFIGVLAGVRDRRVIRTARAALDFIYYAQFEEHTTETLEAMDRAWVEFHQNKVVFVHLGVREHFNINKIHNIKHYVDHIRSRGTADGFNSEATERLHIDFAKTGYRASNRRNYIKQMTVHLQRHAAVHRFRQYLQWAGELEERSNTGSESDDDDEGDIDEEMVEVERQRNESTDGITLKLESTTTFTLPSKPFYPKLTISSIENDFHAPYFLWFTEKFLLENGLNVLGRLSLDDTVAVHQRFTIHLPQVRQHMTDPTTDVVHASRTVPSSINSSGYHKEIPERFDTVMVRMNDENAKAGNVYLSGALTFRIHHVVVLTFLLDVRIGRIQVIFHLPPSLGVYPEPLAYVSLFEPLNQPSPDLGMYRIAWQERRHNYQVYKDAIVVPLSRILRTCHLIPDFSQNVDRAWKPHTVLDSAPAAFLNPYLRFRDFLLFRHLLPTAISNSQSPLLPHRHKRQRLGNT